jgi:hypothetical protein
MNDNIAISRRNANEGSKNANLSGFERRPSVRTLPCLTTLAFGVLWVTGCGSTAANASDAGNDAANSVSQDSGGGSQDSGDGSQDSGGGHVSEAASNGSEAGKDASSGCDAGGATLLDTLAGQWTGPCSGGYSCTWTIASTGSGSLTCMNGQMLSGTIQASGAFSSTNGTGGGVAAFSEDGTITLSDCNTFTYKYTFQIPPNQGTPTASTCTAQRSVGGDP